MASAFRRRKDLLPILPTTIDYINYVLIKCSKSGTKPTGEGGGIRRERGKRLHKTALIY